MALRVEAVDFFRLTEQPWRLPQFLKTYLAAFGLTTLRRVFARNVICQKVFWNFSRHFIASSPPGEPNWKKNAGLFCANPMSERSPCIAIRGPPCAMAGALSFRNSAETSVTK